ncbi:Branched-chain amino acid transport, AzlD [actinobacterium SCGC AAA044-D11]
MNAFWIAVIGSSALAFAIKVLGASVPESVLSHPRILRINNFVPVALLTALVAVNTFADKTKLVIDNRALGMATAVVLLIAKAPFPVVVLGAALTSALAYRYF